MSFKRKYVEPVLIFLTVYAFSVLFFKAGELLSIYAYSYFSSILPSDIISSNPVSDPDAYEAYTLGIALVGTFVGLWLINYISLRLDNAKFEHVISLTDGQYELAEGIKLYFKEFFVSDVIAATAIVAIVTVSAAFIPEKLMDYGLIIVFKLGDTLNSIYYPIISAVIAASFSLITRILSIPLALRTWRALWLSGSV